VSWPKPQAPSLKRLTIVAPGLLVAATGVGAGDLLTASLAGSRVGIGVAVAALIGAALKWTLNEGIARWQISTGTTLIEGWTRHLPRIVQAVFAVYFLLWTIMVGGALVNACGVAGTAFLPLGAPATSKIVWGVIHSFLGLIIVQVGGFRRFEHAMAACVALLFVGVVLTAALVAPPWAVVASSLSTPRALVDELPWTLAVLGGVGGTVTLLSYGYWIGGTGREGTAGLRICRVDLACAYAMTALFGMSMVVIGSRVQVDGQGTGLALVLADQLGAVLGPSGRWAFLVGFWSAVFSSLLGVWQSAPSIFADFFVYRRGGSGARVRPTDLPRTLAYRSFLCVISFGSLPLLWITFTRVQLAYAILGALFMPFLASTLLMLNTRPSLVGRAFTNSVLVNVVLVLILVLFALIGMLQLLGRMPSFGA
jgi:Mn2+/Fe2+ NRAMP family transporter